MNHLLHRIASGLVLLAAVAAIAYWAPAVVGCLALAGIAVLALLEFYRLLDLAGIPSFRIMGAVFSAALIAATWLAHALDLEHLAGEIELFIIFSLVIAILVRQFPQKYNDQPLATMACTLLGFLYVPFLFNYFTKLAFFDANVGVLGRISPTSRLLVFYLIAVVKFNDTGAFLAGRRWGRRKLFHRISPGKTWEGLAGGLALGLATSLAFWALTGGRLGGLTFRLADAVILGLLLPVMGTFGDLTESLLKRAANSKDAGHLVPGMGGILDVIDSLLFAAPALFVYVRCFLTPLP